MLIRWLPLVYLCCINISITTSIFASQRHTNILFYLLLLLPFYAKGMPILRVSPNLRVIPSFLFSLFCYIWKLKRFFFLLKGWWKLFDLLEENIKEENVYLNHPKFSFNYKWNSPSKTRMRKVQGSLKNT